MNRTEAADQSASSLPPIPAIPTGLIFAGLVGGFALGLALAVFAPASLPLALTIAQPVGALWLHALRATIVPLVVALLVTGIVQTAQAANGGAVARRAVIWIVVLYVASAVVGGVVTPLLLWLWPIPRGAALALRANVASLPHAATQMAGAGDFINGLIAPNVLAAASSDAMLPVVLFTTVFAFAAARLPADQRGSLAGFFQAVAGAMLLVVGWVLTAGPIGVFALSLGVAAQSGSAAIGALAHYVVVVSLVGGVITVGSYAAAVLIGRVRLGAFARALIPGEALALSTQSSLASLPAMLDAVRTLGLPSALGEMILPMAVALFRGTGPAMNFAVALYIAHWWGIPLDPAHWLAGLAVASLMSFGAVSLPGAISLISSVGPIALALGAPVEPLALLVAVEMLPDLMRTLGNVTWDVALVTLVKRANAPE